MSKAILCWDGATWHLRFPAPRKGAICGRFGSFQTEAAAEAAATEEWAGAVPVIGHTPHVFETCPCKRCKGQRSASNYYRLLAGKSFEYFPSSNPTPAPPREGHNLENDMRVIWIVEVRSMDGWTTHSEWSNKKDAVDQCDMVRGRIRRVEIAD